MLAPWIESNSLVSKSVSGKEVLLNSGYKMPVIGLGTWTQDDKTVEMSVYEAIKDGYRLIDTAQYYGNETGVGNGVRKAIDEGIVKREDVFVTTKWPSISARSPSIKNLLTLHPVKYRSDLPICHAAVFSVSG